MKAQQSTRKGGRREGREEEGGVSDSSEGSVYSQRSEGIEEEREEEREEEGYSGSEEGESSRTKPLITKGKGRKEDGKKEINSVKKEERGEESKERREEGRGKNIPLSKRRAIGRGRGEGREGREGEREERGEGKEGEREEREEDGEGGKVRLATQFKRELRAIPITLLDDESPPSETELHIFEEILADEILNLTFEVHRKLKTGALCLNCDSADPNIVNRSGYDIFGQTHNQLSVVETFECTNCSRPVVASRFAPHLEKCMGLGRASSRLATKRMKTVDKPEKGEKGEVKLTSPPPASASNFSASSKLAGSDESDQDSANGPMDGDEWRPNSKEERQRLKLRRQQQQTAKPLVPRQHIRKPKSKLDNFDWSDIKIRSLLLTTCGVVSNSTGKMCTKTLKCPQHTDHLRNQLRIYVNERVPSEDPLPLFGTGLGSGGNGVYADSSLDSDEIKRNAGDMSPMSDQGLAQQDPLSSSPPSSPFVDILGDDENLSDDASVATPPQDSVPKKRIKVENEAY
eukprot:Phypoly_transcript_06898.p1 GENE.Phypoly_transcript_06898~~Phypoly_transcript_06898.p1  ORF type:complete len:517 (+),score=129.38 Phypoly_transcript_06898:104-1654(+)